MKRSLINKYCTMMTSLMKLRERLRYLMAYKKMVTMKKIHIITELIFHGGISQYLQSQGHL